MEQMEKHKLLRELVSTLASKLGLLEEAELTCCGVTLAQCQTLVEIGRAGSISLCDLSDRLNLDNSTMSRTVNNLVTKGFCEREADSQDRRYVAIRLTETGSALFMQIEQSMDGYYEAILEALPQDKRDQVLESMELLLQAVIKCGCCS